MAARMRVADKRDLATFLLGVTPAGDTLTHHAWGPLDLEKSYAANCKAGADLLLPGFGPAAIERDAQAAAAAFARFCRSQLGQRGGLTLWFAPMAAPEQEDAAA